MIARVYSTESRQTRGDEFYTITDLLQKERKKEFLTFNEKVKLKQYAESRRKENLNKKKSR